MNERAIVPLDRHPILMRAYEVCQAIERCGASVELTEAVTKAGALLDALKPLVLALEKSGLPLEPTKEMIEAGAQRLVSWEDGCTWPGSWSSLQVSAARNEAERVWRSMWLVAKEAEEKTPLEMEYDERQEYIATLSDAARYQWLRKRFCVGLKPSNNVAELSWMVPLVKWLGSSNFDAVDAAIDEARRTDGPSG